MNTKTKRKIHSIRQQRVLKAYHDELDWDSLRAYVERQNIDGRVLFVGNVAVDIDQIVERQFMCDGRRCVVWRGEDEAEPLIDRSCCNRYDVPVTREGEARIQRHLDEILAVLPDDHPLQENHTWTDIFEYDEDENQRNFQMTSEIGACVFRLYEDGHSLCAVHKAALANNQNPVDWKPITCLLWPLAIDRYKDDDGKTNWFLSVYCSETEGVFEQGDPDDPVACIFDDDEEYPYVYESMKPELEHVFGRDWYQRLLKAIEKHLVVLTKDDAAKVAKEMADYDAFKDTYRR